MNVKLIVHGGVPALLDVMEGLVVRNARAIRKREAPPLSSLNTTAMRYVAQPTWFDAPSAVRDGMASAGTLAAWRAGEIRAQFNDDTVRVALVQGVPMVVAGLGGDVRVLDDPSERHGRVAGFVQPIVEQGDKVTEYLVLDIDSEASAVRDIGDSMAAHNARQIVARNLPQLYAVNGVGDWLIRYTPEDSENWCDAQEIVNRGGDDCEGLAAYRAGEIRAAGGEASVWTRLVEAPSTAMGGRGGGRLFHAITRTLDRSGAVAYDDPSARLGMPAPLWHAEQLKKRRAAGTL